MSRAVVALASTSLALAGATAWLLVERQGGAAPITDALADPAFRAEVERRLVEDAAGVWDATNDPDVGHVLPAAASCARTSTTRTSSPTPSACASGPTSSPNPPVPRASSCSATPTCSALGVEAKERVGARLETMLAKRSGAAVECLSLGISSWNVLAECAFLRRQLALLQPDLVVQVVVPNDLDDVAGARGFGGLSDFSPPLAERASRVTSQHARRVLHPGAVSHLESGLDQESRSRYAEAAGAIEELAAAVEAAGGRYLLLVHTGRYLPVSSRLLAGGLRAEQVEYLPQSLHAKEHWVSPRNTHWNAETQTGVARALYARIERGGLLPALTLPAWPAAADAADALFAEGRRDATADWSPDRPPDGPAPAAAIDFTDLSARTAGQVHGGVYADGSVAPYASMVLAVAGATTLSIRGRCLRRGELDGARVRVFVDEQELGVIAIESGAEVALDLPLRAELAARPFASLRFVADDYVYAAQDVRRCVVFRLTSVVLVK